MSSALLIKKGPYLHSLVGYVHLTPSASTQPPRRLIQVQLSSGLICKWMLIR
jgi:hypothetical protein